MSSEVSGDTPAPSAVHFEIHLYWAPWAAPSRPAPLTARELQGVLPSNVAVHVHDVALSDGLEKVEQASDDFVPRVLPTWRIIALRCQHAVDERVLVGAHPKFEVREALDDLRSHPRLGSDVASA